MFTNTTSDPWSGWGWEGGGEEKARGWGVVLWGLSHYLVAIASSICNINYQYYIRLTELQVIYRVCLSIKAPHFIPKGYKIYINVVLWE